MLEQKLSQKPTATSDIVVVSHDSANKLSTMLLTESMVRVVDREREGPGGKLNYYLSSEVGVT